MSPSARRGYIFFPSMVGAVIVGLSLAAFYLGIILAYASLAFGILFFLYAARYYLATISVLLAPAANNNNGKNGSNGKTNGNGKPPMVSIHVALYNEERVVDRLLTACMNIDYPNYEVVVVDDSNDGTVARLKEWILKGLQSDSQKLKIIHRDNRKGFKGGALNEALDHTTSKAEYIVVFDADFVPEPNILKKFLDYFTQGSNGHGRYRNGNLAAVQGYQWHTLNRSENWLTRGVSAEFSGNYMVDRTFQEVTGVMKMVAGSVYMVRADLLKKFKWSGSITEDWELTLRLYEHGYKVLYTPLIQAPAECPSTLGKLVRQRMRWAEGHTYNVKKHFFPMLLSPLVGIREKVEFLYFAPYYLQSLFLIFGTFSWFASDLLLGAKLPFITATAGWALVLTNLLALPLMSLTGLFLEKRARRDFRGLASQIVLIYALSPYQAFAALKGLIEPIEGSWVRTFKSGKLAGFPGKLEPRKVIKNVLPPKRKAAPTQIRAQTLSVIIVAGFFVSALISGQYAASQTAQPAYYFYNQPAPPSYNPLGSPPGISFLMHLPPPNGADVGMPIGSSQGTGLIFFSDPAPSNVSLPFGGSVSIHLWVDAGGSGSSSPGGSAPAPVWDHTSETATSSGTPSCDSRLPSHEETCTGTQTSTQTGSTSVTETQTTTVSQTSVCDGDIIKPVWECVTTQTTNTQTNTQTQTNTCDGSLAVPAWECVTTSTTQTQPTTETQTTTSGSTSATTTSESTGPTAVGNLKFRIDLYNPSNNSIVHIPGVGETEVFHLQPGVKNYEASWGHMAQNKMILKGETLVAEIWCPDCSSPPVLLFNSQLHPSNIDFPIEVPENSIGLASVALIVPGVAGIVAERRMWGSEERSPKEGHGLRRVEKSIIVAGALLLLTFPLVLTFNDLLANAAKGLGLDRLISGIAPGEAAAVADLLRGFGLHAASSGGMVWLSGAFIPVVATIDWNCAGWQGFLLFGLTSFVGIDDVKSKRGKVSVLLLGAAGVMAVNVLRIFIVVLLAYFVNYQAALVFHDYGGALMTLGWLLAFWTVVLKHQSNIRELEGLAE